jgi:hypothetical protein
MKAVLKSEASHLELTRSINLMVIGKKSFWCIRPTHWAFAKKKIIGLLQKVRILFPWKMNNI